MASPMVQIQITAPVSDAHKSVLTTEAVAFLKKLSSTFEAQRQQCLAQRQRAANEDRPRGIARFPARNRQRARGGLDRRAHSRRI